jgi:hypothetical protein
MRETLFDVSDIPVAEDWVDPSKKRKWSAAFKKWCDDYYIKDDGRSGRFHCSCMSMCDKCEQKFCSACKDCVETMKKIFKENNIKIDYEDYDFEKIWQQAEELCEEGRK